VSKSKTSLDDDSSDDDFTSKSGHRIKRKPGETKEQAIDRVNREKEIERVQKLMRFAFPRQRETHLYKKKLLDPEEQNTSVDIL